MLIRFLGVSRKVVSYMADEPIGQGIGSQIRQDLEKVLELLIDVI
jgi:hypothetical protein